MHQRNNECRILILQYNQIPKWILSSLALVTQHAQHSQHKSNVPLSEISRAPSTLNSREEQFPVMKLHFCSPSSCLCRVKEHTEPGHRSKRAIYRVVKEREETTRPKQARTQDKDLLRLLGCFFLTSFSFLPWKKEELHETGCQLESKS